MDLMTGSGRGSRTHPARFCLYLIKDYAQHLGHADLLREQIDGPTGE